MKRNTVFFTYLARIIMGLSIILGAAGCGEDSWFWPFPTKEPAPSSSAGEQLVDNHDGTVTDVRTHLVWLKDADCFGTKNLAEGKKLVAALADGACQLSDHSRPGSWRVPHIKELLSVLDYARINPVLPNGHPFEHLRSWYWSSTSSASKSGSAWSVNVQDGDSSGSVSRSNMLGILAVRGSEIPLSPRLSDNKNGTVTDKNTGHVWLADADCFGKQRQPDALRLVADLSEGKCGLSDRSEPGDWRVPTIQELVSLIDYSLQGVLIPSGHPFQHLGTYYWSSTKQPARPGYAWNLYVQDGELGLGGDLGDDPVDIPGYLLAVRDK